MILKLSHLLLATTVLHFASSATSRDSTVRNLHEDDRISIRKHRHLFEEITCTLYRKCVTYEASTDHPNGHHKDSWACKLPKNDGTNLDAQFFDIVETSGFDIFSNLTSGTTVTISKGSIDTEKSLLHIPEDADVEAHHAPRNIRGNANVMQKQDDRGVRKFGTLRTLVIRVFDRNNNAPEISVAKLKDDVFNDAASLKSQTDACSYGQLKIQPFVGFTPNNNYIYDGIVDVKTDYVVGGDQRGIDQVALIAAEAQLGDLDDPEFGLVMFCLPPGASKYIAFAYPNTKYSFYNSKSCGHVMTQMHEVGHNLGLGHSGEFGASKYREYGDSTGIMGTSPALDDMKKCYNTQKNYQLGWYADKVATINSIDNIGRLEFKLNGVSDYKRNNDALIVLRLNQISKDQDFYIGYNRAEGINKDTEEDRNMVTIIRKEYGAPDQYSQSTKVASLQPGERFVIPNFNDGVNPVQVAFLDAHNGDARIEVVEECKKFTVQFITDNFPEDNTLSIVDTTGVSPPLQYRFNRRNREYFQEICLPMGPTPITYRFSILDSFGDGVCCGHGMGSYSAYNDRGQVVFSSPEGDFRTKNYDIQVPRSTSPLRSAPSPSEQSNPTPPCRDHLIEFRTDGYPGDSSWELVRIRDTNEVVTYGNELVTFNSPAYTKQDRKYTTKVCLDEDFEYSFRVHDSYTDGICCGFDEQSKGYYRVIDECSGEVLVNSGMKDEDFGEKVYTFVTEVTTNGCAGREIPPVEESRTRKPRKNNSKCKNKSKTPFRIENSLEEKSCKAHAKRNKCDRTVTADNEHNGKYVWELCKKACERCDESGMDRPAKRRRKRSRKRTKQSKRSSTKNRKENVELPVII